MSRTSCGPRCRPSRWPPTCCSSPGKPSTPTRGRSVELLASQLDRFESLLVDLLEISRYDAGAATLDADLVDVCDLVRRSADDAQQLAGRRGSRIEFRLPATGCFAEVDRRRVERILRNILVNAVEHGEGKDVVVTCAIDSDAVAVSVRDYGVGLRPGEEQRVFERFWRADPARARTTGGTGLGLAISLEDARLHGGWLQAWGERGQGLGVPADPAPRGRPGARGLAAAARPGRGRDAPASAGGALPRGRASRGDLPWLGPPVRLGRMCLLVAVVASVAGCVGMPAQRPGPGVHRRPAGHRSRR